MVNLYRDVASASKTAEAFLRDTNSLLGTLHDVQNLLRKARSAHPRVALDEVHLTSLKLQLDDCNRDISSWLSVARKYRRHGSNGSKRWFKKFWIAINGDVVKNVRVEIHLRRAEIAVALAVLGRSVHWIFDMLCTRLTSQIYGY